jgi:hypothetical protein
VVVKAWCPQRGQRRSTATFNESFTRDRYLLDAGVPTTLLARGGFPLDRRLNPPGDFQLTRDWQNQIVFNTNLTKRFQLRNAFFSRRNRDQYLDAETMSYSPATDVLARGELYNLTSRLRVNLAGRYDDFRRTAHNDVYNNDVFVSAGPETRRHQTNYRFN